MIKAKLLERDKPKTPNEKTANKKLQIGETRTHL